MSDVFTLTGDRKTEPSTGAPSSDPVLSAPLDEKVSLLRKHYTTVLLDADAEVSVSLGGLTSYSTLVIKAVGGKLRAKVASADGSAQLFPVDPFALIISKSVPFTALSLTRVAGIEVTAKVFLGQYSS